MNAGLVCTKAPAPLAGMRVCALGLCVLLARRKHLGWGLEREHHRCAPCVLEDVCLTWHVTGGRGNGDSRPGGGGISVGGPPLGAALLGCKSPAPQRPSPCPGKTFPRPCSLAQEVSETP